MGNLNTVRTINLPPSKDIWRVNDAVNVVSFSLTKQWKLWHRYLENKLHSNLKHCQTNIKKNINPFYNPEVSDYYIQSTLSITIITLKNINLKKLNFLTTSDTAYWYVNQFYRLILHKNPYPTFTRVLHTETNHIRGTQGAYKYAKTKVRLPTWGTLSKQTL